jgi:Complex 1 protein (LYR family)
VILWYYLIKICYVQCRHSGAKQKTKLLRFDGRFSSGILRFIACYDKCVPIRIRIMHCKSSGVSVRRSHRTCTSAAPAQSSKMPTRHSGLQKDVLKLYRDLYRAARKKDPLNINNFTSVVMQEFRVKAASVTKTDFKTIEHLLRYGYKQKKLIEMPGFRTGGVTSSS